MQFDGTEGMSFSEEFRHWVKLHRITLSEAEDLLGEQPHTLMVWYKGSARPLPRVREAVLQKLRNYER